MKSKEKLRAILKEIDGRGYKSYKRLGNQWYDFGDFTISIPYVQGDPFASPSKVFIRVEQNKAGFPGYFLEKKIRCEAVEDFITRLLDSMIRRYTKGNRGSGKSGKVFIARTGQEVIERTSVEFNEKYIEGRIYVGLPARGRRVLGQQADKIFFEELVKIAEKTLFYNQIKKQELRKHVEVVEDQQVLRQSLVEKGMVTFIANGSILPRRSGIDDRPLTEGKAVFFKAPADYEVDFDLPYKGKIKGMGIPEGITLIVGGGYHGKSTLLRAVELGVYNHIPGDGREYVVTRDDAFKIRAEDGRRVERVDISPFINNLPQKVSTREFSTENASGSTSQAANIMEALELGVKVLLIDEDTSATNFMIRDARMQRLVSDEKEPITPFIDKVSPLYKEHGVSTILVIGGSGDYFDVADQVIMMEEYLPELVTDQVKGIAREISSLRDTKVQKTFGLISDRYPAKSSINPGRKRKVKVRSRGKDTIQFGYDDIDLSNLEQLVSEEQTRAIGDMIVYMLKNNMINDHISLKDVLKKVFAQIDSKGLELISPFRNPEGDYVRPRMYEVGATLNRLRTLEVKSIK